MSRENDPVLAGMLKRRTIVLSGEINAELIGDVRRRFLLLQFESSDPINLIIDSPGGSFTPTMELCDLISCVLIAPVRGIAIGSCKSAATLVMLHCAERWGTPHSQYLIHSGSTKISLPVNQSTAARAEELLRELKRDEEAVIRMYMSKLKKTRKQVLGLIARGDQDFDECMDVYEAKKVGLITHVIQGKLDIMKV